MATPQAMRFLSSSSLSADRNNAETQLYTVLLYYWPEDDQVKSKHVAQ